MRKRAELEANELKKSKEKEIKENLNGINKTPDISIDNDQRT